MSPVNHFLAGWALANAAGLNSRERMLVTVAGVIPDLDGFGIVVDLATRHSTFCAASASKNLDLDALFRRFGRDDDPDLVGGWPDRNGETRRHTGGNFGVR